MPKKQSKALVAAERIEQSILLIRGHKVLLDSDLAQLYGVETKALVRAMKRNIDRFPDDFMFQLTRDEWTALGRQIGTLDLRRQIGTSSSKSDYVTPGNASDAMARDATHGGRRYPPYVFTEQGVAMLSSVLRSPRAVQVNIEIMRAFVRLRRILAVNAELARRLDEVESHLGKHDEQFSDVIRAIRQLMEPPTRPPRRHIGFHVPDDASSIDRPPGDRGTAKRTQRNQPQRAKRASRGGE
jgi:hypothetical protein